MAATDRLTQPVLQEGVKLWPPLCIAVNVAQETRQSRARISEPSPPKIDAEYSEPLASFCVFC